MTRRAAPAPSRAARLARCAPLPPRQPSRRAAPAAGMRAAAAAGPCRRGPVPGPGCSPGRARSRRAKHPPFALPPPAPIRLRKHDVGKAAQAAALHSLSFPAFAQPRDKSEGGKWTCKVLQLLKPAEAFDPLQLPSRDVRPWKPEGANLTTSAGTLHFENTFAKEGNFGGWEGGV